MNKRIKKKKAKRPTAVRHNILYGSGCIWSTFGKHRIREIVMLERKECDDLIKEVWYDKYVYTGKDGDYGWLKV